VTREVDPKTELIAINREKILKISKSQQMLIKTEVPVPGKAPAEIENRISASQIRNMSIEPEIG
jgi:hypothetical protein